MSMFLLKSLRTAQKYWIDSKIETSIPLIWSVNFYHCASADNSSQSVQRGQPKPTALLQSWGSVGLRCVRILHLLTYFIMLTTDSFPSETVLYLECLGYILHISGHGSVNQNLGTLMRKGYGADLAEPPSQLKISPLSPTVIYTNLSW